MLSSLDETVDSSIGGLKKATEEVLDTYHKVPLFGFRNLNQIRTSEWENFMKRIDESVQTIHQKFANAPAKKRSLPIPDHCFPTPSSTKLSATQSATRSSSTGKPSTTKSSTTVKSTTKKVSTTAKSTTKGSTTTKASTTQKPSTTRKVTTKKTTTKKSAPTRQPSRPPKKPKTKGRHH